jgi:hypothetical protein
MQLVSLKESEAFYTFLQIYVVPTLEDFAELFGGWVNSITVCRANKIS